MMERFFKILNQGLVGTLIIFFGQMSSAAKLISHCVLNDSTQEVEGQNLDERLPIASVSKIHTSLIAATTFNLQHKFFTQVYVSTVAPGIYNVHLKGSLDPYFNKSKLHMIISRLNELKITQIQNLTFDENVKYLHETDTSRGFRVGGQLIQPLTLKAELNFPQPDLVTRQLQNMSYILKTYPESYKLAASMGVKLFKNPKLKVQKTSFKTSAEFEPDANSQQIYVASQDLKTILKSLNWNSNNHAANQMFSVSGGHNRFADLFYGTFKEVGENVFFVNGSGQNHDMTGQGRLYNEATCRNTVRTVRMLKKAVENQNAKITDVLAVVGTDKGSTVGGVVYSNPMTTGAVAAKTGTIGTHVTLAGVANTKNGLKYFMYYVELGYPSAKVKNKRAWLAQEDDRGRRLISIELTKLMKTSGGPVKFNYTTENPLKDNLENYDETENSLAQGLLSQPTEE